MNLKEGSVFAENFTTTRSKTKEVSVVFGCIVIVIYVLYSNSFQNVKKKLYLFGIYCYYCRALRQQLFMLHFQLIIVELYLS